MKLGEKWYLINKDWYNKWTTFINRNNFNRLEWPGVINNDYILNDSNTNSFKINDSFFSADQLRSSLTQYVHYFIVCEELWEYLKTVYGLSKKEVFLLIFKIF